MDGHGNAKIFQGYCPLRGGAFGPLEAKSPEFFSSPQFLKLKRFEFPLLLLLY